MEFKNFTSQMNKSFKVAFDNGLVVSLSFSDHNCEESFDDNNNYIDPQKMPIFTFRQADMAVFRQSDSKFMSKLFCKHMDGYSGYDEAVIHVTPAQYAEVLFKVSQWKE
jgi:hypothetical protein